MTLADVATCFSRSTALLTEAAKPVAGVTAFATVGFPFDDDPTVNSQGELTVATSGSHNLRRRSKG